jgi:hypothetical protein
MQQQGSNSAGYFRVQGLAFGSAPLAHMHQRPGLLPDTWQHFTSVIPLEVTAEPGLSTAPMGVKTADSWQDSGGADALAQGRSTSLTLVRFLGSTNDLPAMARYSVKLRDTLECSTCFTCGSSENDTRTSQ